MPLIRLAVTPSAPGTREALSAALFGAGCLGLHEDGDTLVTVVTSSAEDAVLLDALMHAVRGADVMARSEISELPDVDWSQEWRTRIGAHAVGALTIVPPWMAEGRDARTTVVIEPQMAFGTGEHQTTRCMVRLMQGVIRAGDTVADLGAGSAVLSIAAVKLGAVRAAAIEMDHDAIANAEWNVAQNGVAGQVTVLEGSAALLLPLVAPVRVVLANILSSVLVELLPCIAESVPAGGAAILSGILVTEREEMLEIIATDGHWRVVSEEREGDWWAVNLERTG